MSVKEDFFKAVLKLFFYEVFKTPSKVYWDDKYNVITVTLKLPSLDYIVRIYDDHYTCMTSHSHPGYQVHTHALNNIEFEGFFKTVLLDDIPF